MKIKKLESGRYEAIGTINDINLTLLDGTIFWMSFIAYGDTFFEAIQNFFIKVDKHLHPENYPTIEEMMDDNSDEISKAEWNGNIPHGYDSEGNFNHNQY